MTNVQDRKSSFASCSQERISVSTFLLQIIQRIVEAHVNIKDLSLIDAKMSYIKAWQSLPEYGVSLFVIRMMDHKKDQLLGVTHNRIMTMDINTGDLIKTWRYNTMKVSNYYYYLHNIILIDRLL